MTREIEDELKLANWLSVLTFDAYKYATAGGDLVIEFTDNGLVLRLPGIHLDTNGISSKFKRHAEATGHSEPQPAAAEMSQ